MEEISEKIKYLRELGNNPDVYMVDNDELQDAFLSAADTIESLSAKLAEMERSAEDLGGWIPCSERLPEEDSDFIVTFRDGECVIAYLDDNDKWVNSSTGLEIAIQVMAWHRLPPKYHEP